MPAESQSSRMADMSMDEITIKANRVTDEVGLSSDTMRMLKKIMILLVPLLDAVSVPVKFPAHMKAAFYFSKLEIKLLFSFVLTCLVLVIFQVKCG